MRNWSDSDKAAYEGSARVPDPPVGECGKEVRAFLACDGSDPAARRDAAQAVLDSLCEAGKVPKLRLTVQDRNIRTCRGLYRYTGNRGLGITLVNRTAARGKPVAAKRSLETLCHEFTHHWEISGGLGKSFHTAPFGLRVHRLYSRLLEKAGAKGPGVSGGKTA